MLVLSTCLIVVLAAVESQLLKISAKVVKAGLSASACLAPGNAANRIQLGDLGACAGALNLLSPDLSLVVGKIAQHAMGNLRVIVSLLFFIDSVRLRITANP